MAYWTGKFETLGSNFSNETGFAGYLRPPTTTAKVLFIRPLIYMVFYPKRLAIVALVQKATIGLLDRKI